MICKINMRLGKVYLKLILQRVDRVLKALEDVHTQAGAARTVHRVPGLDEPAKLAEFSSARSEQIRQNLGVERHSVAFLLWWLKGLGE